MTDSAKARSSRASGSAPDVTSQHDGHRQRDQAHAGQHGGAGADRRLDLAVDAEALDDAVQRDGDDDRLEHQRDGRRDVEMRRVLDVGLPGDRQGQHEGVQGKGVEQRVEPVLRDQQEADQHQPAGEQMGDVEGEAVLIYSVLDTNSSSVPSRPSISAAPTKSGRRKTRILAIDVSNSASSTPATASLAA